MKTHDLPGIDYTEVYIPAAGAADASAILTRLTAPYKATLASLSYRPVSVLQGADANSMNLNAQLGDGTEVGNKDFTAGKDATVAAGAAIALTGTAAQLAFAAGDALLIQREKVGNGLVMPAGCIRAGWKGA